MKIFITGLPGTGKSTLSKTIFEILNFYNRDIKKYHIDKIFWDENFNKKKDRNEKLQIILNKENYIIEGITPSILFLDKILIDCDLIILLKNEFNNDNLIERAKKKEGNISEFDNFKNGRVNKIKNLLLREKEFIFFENQIKLNYKSKLKEIII